MTLTLQGNHRPAPATKPSRFASLAPPGWELVRRPEGWLELGKTWSGPPGADSLAAHADMAGPVKLVEKQGKVEQRVAFFLGQSAEAALLDEEAALGLEELIAELVPLGCALGGPNPPNGWSAPPVETLVAWLNDAGHETAVDKDRNVRLTVKRVGCDGQVTVYRGAGALRFVLPLGSWPELGPIAASALATLAREVNAHCRLVRIARRMAEKTQAFEAQVDLSGLPFDSPVRPHCERLWREMTRLSVKGLELALCQLGLELPLLADPRNRDLAELLLAGAN